MFFISLKKGIYFNRPEFFAVVLFRSLYPPPAQVSWDKQADRRLLTLIRMTKDEKGLAFFKGLLL